MPRLRSSRPPSPTQAVPNYPPPSQPAPYVAPYVAPMHAVRAVRRAASGGRAAAATVADTAGSGQSGRARRRAVAAVSGTVRAGGYPCAGVSAGAGTVSAQAVSAGAAPYPAQDGYVSTPWPMSPAARDAQAYAGETPSARDQLETVDRQEAGVGTRRAGVESVRGALSAASALSAAGALSAAALTHNAAALPAASAVRAAAAVLRPATAVHASSALSTATALRSGSHTSRNRRQATPSRTTRRTQGAGQPSPAAVASTQTQSVADELAQIKREQASTVSGGHRVSQSQRRGRPVEPDRHRSADRRPHQGGQRPCRRARRRPSRSMPAPQPPTRRRSRASARACERGAHAPSRTNYGSQTATGVGLSVGYENRNIKGDVGVDAARLSRDEHRRRRAVQQAPSPTRSRTRSPSRGAPLPTACSRMPARAITARASNGAA